MLIAFGGVLWMIALLAMVLVDANPEWETHQAEQRKVARASADDAASVRHAERFKVQVKQIDLPTLERVDRCISCHVGIEDPAFASAPLPIAAHPGKLLTIHAPERFGCTICHGGNGRATSREDAHGLPEPSLHPMLRGGFLQGSCGKCHGDDEFVAGSRLEVGRRLFDYGCRTCHRLYQSGNTAGPDLTRWGARSSTRVLLGQRLPRHRSKRRLLAREPLQESVGLLSVGHAELQDDGRERARSRRLHAQPDGRTDPRTAQAFARGPAKP